MSSNVSRRSRLGAGLVALSAAAALSVGLAAPATALVATGEAVIAPAAHKKGRTLSGQGVKLAVGGTGSSATGKLNLPVGNLEFGTKPSASTGASLTFSKGKKSMIFTDVRFDLAAGTVAGKFNGGEVPIFWLGAAPKANDAAGSIALSEGKLRLNADTAKALKGELGLKRALINKNVGVIWLAAQASPTLGPAKPVTSGTETWGFLASWRGYVLFADPPNFGSITLSEGATPNGSLMSPATTWNFPIGSGSFQTGLYGATDRFVLQGSGAVKFAKPGHCIMEIKLANPRVTFDGANSNLVVDLTYDIDKPLGPPGSCEDLGPAVSVPGTTFATLDPGAVTPSWSGDGKTVTWTGVPAALTTAGAVPFGSFYKAGQALEPITVTAGIG